MPESLKKRLGQGQLYLQRTIDWLSTPPTLLDSIQNKVEVLLISSSMINRKPEVFPQVRSGLKSQDITKGF